MKGSRVQRKGGQRGKTQAKSDESPGSPPSREQVDRTPTEKRAREAEENARAAGGEEARRVREAGTRPGDESCHPRCDGLGAETGGQELRKSVQAMSSRLNDLNGKQEPRRQPGQRDKSRGAEGAKGEKMHPDHCAERARGPMNGAGAKV